MTPRQAIELVLFFVKLADREPEDDPSDTRQDADARVVPDEQRIRGQCYLGNGIVSSWSSI